LLDSRPVYIILFFVFTGSIRVVEFGKVSPPCLHLLAQRGICRQVRLPQVVELTRVRNKVSSVLRRMLIEVVNVHGREVVEGLVELWWFLVDHLISRARVES